MSIPLDKLREMYEQATPGPWQWVINLSCRSVSIESARWVVMDFVRWGMSAAAPAFAGKNRVLRRVEEFAEIEPGREHHAHWHRIIKHPDAELMVAAFNALPDYFETVSLLESERRRVEELEAALEEIRREANLRVDKTQEVAVIQSGGYYRTQNRMPNLYAYLSPTQGAQGGAREQ